jgi:hypothetical protein
MSDDRTDLSRTQFGMVLNFCIMAPVLTLCFIMVYMTFKESGHDLGEDLPRIMQAAKGLGWILTGAAGYQALNLGLKSKRRP